MRVPLKWQDPPESASGRDGWIKGAVAQLRANPGRWALVAQAKYHNQASSTVNHLKRRGVEAVARLSGDAVHIYARYVNGAAPAEE